MATAGTARGPSPEHTTSEHVSFDRLRGNALDLEHELAWFERIVQTRARELIGGMAGEPAGETQDEPPDSMSEHDLTPPDLDESPSPYGEFLRHYEPDPLERLALVTALVPHIRPSLLDPLDRPDPRFGRRFTQVGGVVTDDHPGLWPTWETLAFLAGGDELIARFALFRLIDPRHFFSRHGLFEIENRGDSADLRSPLRLTGDFLVPFTHAWPRLPAFGPSFPASRLTTRQAWDDLVLHPRTREQVEHILDWLHHGEALLEDWGLGHKQRPGFRSLFYGPPGTGKTLTAGLLGKVSGREVFRLDLSMVVSKFIGETEKNLARVFDQAQHKGWILFFDEADALFGRRTETRSSHDRHANQEVAYLLQRIENFDGVAILASNLRENIDEAFSRRFDSIIHFPAPRPQERLELWHRALPGASRIDPDVDLERLAQEHQLTGGGIANAVRFAALRALAGGREALSHDHLLDGIRKEYAKEGLVT